MGKGVLTTVVESLFPRRCMACNAFTGDRCDGFCAECQAGLWPWARPWCETCSRPLYGGAGTARTCGECAGRQLPYRRLLAAFHYGGPMADAIVRFKHGNHPEFGRRLGKMMVSVLVDELPEADVLVPVPLHPARAFLRGYNQAELLAQELGRSMATPVVRGLVRVANTGSQRDRSRQERLAALSGAFRVPKPKTIAGLRVVLVDDVVTTGATSVECAKTLRQAGVREVCVVSLARVPPEMG